MNLNLKRGLSIDIHSGPPGCWQNEDARTIRRRYLFGWKQTTEQRKIKTDIAVKLRLE